MEVNGLEIIMLTCFLCGTHLLDCIQSHLSLNVSNTKSLISIGKLWVSPTLTQIKQNILVILNIRRFQYTIIVIEKTLLQFFYYYFF